MYVMRVIVCCSVLQCVAVRCSVLRCGAVCCSALQCIAVRCGVLQFVAVRCGVLQCVAHIPANFFFFHGVLGGGDRLRPDHVIDSTCIAGCCSALHCVAVHCSALHAHMLYLFSGLLLEDFGAVVSVFRGNLFGVEGLGFRV